MSTRNSKDLIVKSLSPWSGFVVLRLLNPNLFISSSKSKNRILLLKLNLNPVSICRCCRSTLKQRWSDVENESKSHVGFSTLHNVDTTLHLDVETTSKQRRSTLKQRRNNCTKLKQRRNNVAQLRYNFVSTLF